MNFYEYHQPGEELAEAAVYLAAKDLMSNGFQVIPLTKGKKEPANIRSVYEIIAHPINLQNFDFYFKDRNVDLGLIMDYNMEFIDIDPKNKKGIEQQVLKAIELGWQELYDKLVIDFTPSGGCHIIYRSEVIGGSSTLAKVKHSPNPLAIIERINRHNKQYIKISPSDGYNLTQRNPFEIPFLTAEERNWISAVCASFNEIHKPEVKKKESEREDSPWVVFNSTHDWKYIRNELIDRGWSVYSDRDDKVMIKRPGDTAQSYSGCIYKDTNILYLYTPSTEFQNEKGYSPFGVYALLNHDGNAGSACRQLASEGCGKNIYDEGQFWKREKNKIKIKYTELLQWYHSIGYHKYNGAIVQVIDNIVEIVDESLIKRAFINEVEFEMQDDMYEKVSTIFSESGGLMSMLKELPDNFIRDGKDETWLFFSNIAIRVTPDAIDPVPYNTIKGLIWKTGIMSRNYYGTTYEGCDADRFIKILGGDKATSLQKIIGYMISKYKDPMNPRAVIIMEDIDPETEGESQGGSGKGLCVQLVRQFRKITDIDGKNIRFTDPFLFQNVDLDTDIIFIDDVEKNFKFTCLYSILTNPMQVNKKNKAQIIIPFEDSPKVVLTSNYSIGGMDASSNRRKYEFPVVKYFGEHLEPVQMFNRQFFAGWDRDEWLRFDNFIIDCCQKYLAEGDKKSIGNKTDKSQERSLVSNTNREFIEYMDGQLATNFFDFAPFIVKNLTVTYADKTHTTNAVNMSQVEPENPDHYFLFGKQTLTEKISKMCNYKNLTPNKLTIWLNRWAESRSVEIDALYKRSSDGERFYRIIKWNSISSVPQPEKGSGTTWQADMEFKGF